MFITAKEKNNKCLLIDKLFVTEYLPFAPENCVKAYILGLAATDDADNSLASISEKLDLTADETLDCFRYWEEQGLITLTLDPEPRVEYKEVASASAKVRTFSKAKYKAFNEQLQAMLPARAIMPNEYNEYYNAMETLHIEPEAMLTVIAYCVRQKGESIGWRYVLTVARNLAAEGYTSYERISERLNELDDSIRGMGAILKALGSKRAPDIEDKRLFLKWTKTMGFAADTIQTVAKTMKKGGVEQLDRKLVRYYESHAFSLQEITVYEETREKVFSLTAQILKVLGKYYERLDYIIETYTMKWLGFGFEDKALIKIADFCFKKSYRDLETMDGVVADFYRRGLLTEQDVSARLAEAENADAKIRRVLEKAGIKRSVNSWDRDCYRTWTFSWQMPEEVIMYAAEISAGKGMAYIGGILANWNNRGIKTVEAAKKSGADSIPAVANAVTKKSVDELNALFSDAEEV